MKRYIAIKIIHAEREDREVEGYKVIMNDGYISWIPKILFDDAYREAEGYKIIYANGYVSWSLKDVVEEANCHSASMPFGLALEHLKKGNKIYRTGWGKEDMWLELQCPTPNSKMTLPYIFLNYSLHAQNTIFDNVPWTPSQTDLLAEDWTCKVIASYE